MIGEVISGRYEIIEKLGEGGMANVYKARCKILKRFISIKILKQELTSDEEFVRKFKDEAMEVAKLSNNNIVKVYDIGTEGNIHYIVMEYIDGKTLKEYISDAGVLSIKSAIDFSIQICNALIVAHDINLIHRDVKSQNILVSNSGEIKVTDFGIAKSSDSATITNSGKILGSAYYISPEQAKGNFVDCRSDIYSFGVVLYEMFTGKLPFTQGTPVNIALQHIQVDPIEPIEFNDKLPIGINNLIIRCLQKNPALRYQNIKEIRNDLLAIQNNKKHFVAKYNLNDSTMVMDPLNVDDMAKRNKNKKNGLIKSIIILLVSFIILVLFVFLFWVKDVVGLFSQNVEVPSVVGKIGSQYQRELESLGLKYELSGYVESDLEKNFVVDTYPKSGSLLKKGDTVKVILSEGIEQVKVPDLINKTLDEARVILRNNDLKIGNIEERFSEIYDVGKIMIQTPSYNSEVDKNKTIDVVISKGSETRLVIVPEFIGLDIVEAQNLATLNGISIEFNSVDTSIKDDHEKVFDQSIPKDIEIRPSVVIQLTYYNYVEKQEENQESVDDKLEDKNDKQLGEIQTDNLDQENSEEDYKEDDTVTIPSFDNLTIKDAKEIFNELGLELDGASFNEDDLIKQIDYEKGEKVSLGTKVKVISVY